MNVAFWTALRLSALSGSLLFVSGCGFWPEVSYRYKLTLVVDTPEGEKSAFSVVELDFYKSADGNTPHRTLGQSLVLDLGARGALVALVVQIREGKWGQTDPGGVLWAKCGGGGYAYGYITLIETLKNCRSSYPLGPSEQPDLIYFRDAANPKSGVLVNPKSTMPSLGPDIKIKSVTMQVTDEVLTHGIDDHLPWARAADWRLEIPVGDGVSRLSNWIARGRVIQGE